MNEDNRAGTPDERQVLVTTVNGQEHRGVVDVRTTLADFLRHDLGLTGTHLGCEHGVCGACTVLVGGKAVRSCLDQQPVGVEAVFLRERRKGVDDGGLFHTSTIIEMSFGSQTTFQ